MDKPECLIAFELAAAKQQAAELAAAIDRNRDAAMIQQGACNPVAILGTMHKHALAMSRNGLGTTAIRNDPAMRLMCHQLAFLLNVGQIDDSLTEYGELMVKVEGGAE